jgi:hypothetical protein
VRPAHHVPYLPGAWQREREQSRTHHARTFTRTRALHLATHPHIHTHTHTHTSRACACARVTLCLVRVCHRRVVVVVVVVVVSLSLSLSLSLVSRAPLSLSVAGCIPVIVADDVQLAFERQLPWTTFSLRVSEADATSTPLVPYLRALPASRVASLRAGLRRVRAHFLFGVGEPFALGSTPGGASDLALRAVGAAAASDSCGTQLAQVALRQAAHKSERRSHAKARAVAVPAHSNRGKHPAAGHDATVGAHESAKVVDEILFDSAREHGSPRLHASAAYASQGADAVVRDKSADDGELLNGETAADPASLVGKRARIVRLLARAEYNATAHTVPALATSVVHSSHCGVSIVCALQVQRRGGSCLGVPPQPWGALRAAPRERRKASARARGQPRAGQRHAARR